MMNGWIAIAAPASDHLSATMSWWCFNAVTAVVLGLEAAAAAW